MKIKLTFSLFIAAICISFTPIAEKALQSEGKKPEVFTENYKKEVKEGDIINCRKVYDMGFILYFNDKMKNADMFRVELHRFGEDKDDMVASKTFIPGNKEYKKKYAGKESVKLKLLAEEDDFGGSDLEVNILMYPIKTHVNDIFCDFYKFPKLTNFYLVVKSFTKTGEKTQFGEDAYLPGVEISPRSVTFKNWDSKTK